MTLSWDKAVDELAAAIPAGPRWTHIWGVVETALALATRHQVDPEPTAWAALLHDCAKCLDLPTLESLVRREGLAEDEDDRSTAQVWHALVGAHLARTRYGIRDERILQAIRHHPTGTPHMDDLGMILFVADYTEPSRHYPGSRELRIRALEAPLAEAALGICRNKIAHVKDKGRSVHRRSLRTVQALESRLGQSPDPGLPA